MSSSHICKNSNKSSSSETKLESKSVPSGMDSTSIITKLIIEYIGYSPIMPTLKTIYDRNILSVLNCNEIITKTEISDPPIQYIAKYNQNSNFKMLEPSILQLDKKIKILPYLDKIHHSFEEKIYNTKVSRTGNDRDMIIANEDSLIWIIHNKIIFHKKEKIIQVDHGIAQWNTAYNIRRKICCSNEYVCLYRHNKLYVYNIIKKKFIIRDYQLNFPCLVNKMVVSNNAIYFLIDWRNVYVIEIRNDNLLPKQYIRRKKYRTNITDIFCNNQYGYLQISGQTFTGIAEIIPKTLFEETIKVNL